MSDSSGADSIDATSPEAGHVEPKSAVPEMIEAELAEGDAELATADSGDAGADPDLVEAIEETRVTVRRTPRYFRLMATGAIVAAVVVFIWTYSLPEQPNTPRNEVFGFMLLWGVIVGIGVGAVVALLLDLLARRWVRTVPAEHITTTELERPDGSATGGEPNPPQ